MNSKLKKIARTGYVAKGSVYAITGILTFLAAFNMGGQKAGKFQALEFLEKQSFGNAILIVMGIGLLCYVIWRAIQVFQDPENIGSDKKGKVKRAAFGVSALIYLALAVSAFMKVINAGGSSGSGSQSPGFMTGQVGVFIFAAIGIAVIGAGINQIKKAYTKSFLSKFDYKSISEEKRRKTIKNTGLMGLIARGVIFFILGYFFIRAAIESNTSEIKSTTDAFSFLQDSSYGQYLLGAVAAGLVCYGIYMFMMAKYRKFKA
ncbi:MULTISPECIES: DUF1206 domain-containing protein [Zunongwangia]|uniref:Membrane protein n=2 Tax=Zunongwangia profunda TaxID=398743 RepID=D5BF37_ZUNPS|nr:DUF1206 domain-containing protein [Zunongwangia profunda]ADF52935.1 membrane protein [Zunongwangia profunda SM-A87]HAJ82325.1 DUF1206 domain-containing protein [Zunongwangia profunda]HCV80842.1 DUF1206 domain-containing protein [Zunongwangia profunda]|tara:strand:- start:287 stop:1069 length:783 start_codon:yes stop_codon:yes gene_type:complete